LSGACSVCGGRVVVVALRSCLLRLWLHGRGENDGASSTLMVVSLSSAAPWPLLLVVCSWGYVSSGVLVALGVVCVSLGCLVSPRSESPFVFVCAVLRLWVNSRSVRPVSLLRFLLLGGCPVLGTIYFVGSSVFWSAPVSVLSKL